MAPTLPTIDAPTDQIAGGRNKPTNAAGGDTISKLADGTTDTDNAEKDKKIAKKEGEEEKSSLKIHIKLDLDIEVHLTARIKGDITIGLL